MLVNWPAQELVSRYVVYKALAETDAGGLPVYSIECSGDGETGHGWPGSVKVTRTLFMQAGGKHY